MAATRFDGLPLPRDVARKLSLLKLSLTLPAPSEAKKREELTRRVAAMQSAYGKGKWCPEGEKDCLDITALGRLMATSRDEKRLRAAWTGWHAIAPPMKADYARYVELANEGARELGYRDLGVYWRSKYDMPADEFGKELDRLW